MRISKVIFASDFIKPEFSILCKDDDEVISKILDLIGTKTKTIIDVGIGESWHEGPVHRTLLRDGWNGFCIEATRHVYELFCDIYKENKGVKVFHHKLRHSQDYDYLDELVLDLVGDSELDILSLRLKGPEWQFLNSLKSRPRVLAILFNPSIPSSVEYVQEDGDDVHKGASLLALKLEAKQKGYELAYVGRLAIFVREDLFESLGSINNNLDRIWGDFSWQSRIMIGFNGYIVLAGNRKLLWNRLGGESKLEFTEEDIQVLPKGFRRLFW